MKFRIKKYDKGYVVEIKKRKWLRTYWTHYISVSGINEKPWYHSTFDYAMMSLVDKIKCDTISNSRNELVNRQHFQ